MLPKIYVGQDILQGSYVRFVLSGRTRRPPTCQNPIFCHFLPILAYVGICNVLLACRGSRCSQYFLSKRKKIHNINNFQGKIGPLLPRTPLGPLIFYIRPLGCPKFIYVRNVAHLEMQGKPLTLKTLDPHPRDCPEKGCYFLWPFFTSDFLQIENPILHAFF